MPDANLGNVDNTLPPFSIIHKFELPFEILHPRISTETKVGSRRNHMSHSRYQPMLEFANLHLTFGDFVMADWMEEIVLPAFFNKDNVREYDGSRMFFYQCRFQRIEVGSSSDEPAIAIVGQFFYDTVLESLQTFEDGVGPKPNNERIKSAPSSLFVLILNSHKILYLKEQKTAPTTHRFRTTLLHFIKLQRKTFLAECLAHANEIEERAGISNKEKTKLIDLEFQLPIPSIELLAIAGDETISSYLDRFSHISNVRVEIIKTNHEPYNGALFEELESRGKVMGAAKSAVSFSATDEKSLPKDAVLETVKPVALDGLAKVRVSGKDKEGNRLSGTEEDFKTQIPQKNLPELVSERFQTMIQAARARFSRSDVMGDENDTRNKKVFQTLLRRSRETREPE